MQGRVDQSWRLLGSEGKEKGLGASEEWACRAGAESGGWGEGWGGVEAPMRVCRRR